LPIIHHPIAFHDHFALQFERISNVNEAARCPGVGGFVDFRYKLLQNGREIY
jgi:hypothetical protein